MHPITEPAPENGAGILPALPPPPPRVSRRRLVGSQRRWPARHGEQPEVPGTAVFLTNRHREQAGAILRDHPGQRLAMHFGLGAGLLQEEPQRTDRHEIRIAILNRRRRRLPRPLYSLLPCFIERVDTGMFGERFQDRGQTVRREVSSVALIVGNNRDAERARWDRRREVVCHH
jgi:hypothetical protein